MHWCRIKNSHFDHQRPLLCKFWCHATTKSLYPFKTFMIIDVRPDHILNLLYVNRYNHYIVHCTKNKSSRKFVSYSVVRQEHLEIVLVINFINIIIKFMFYKTVCFCMNKIYSERQKFQHAIKKKKNKKIDKIK